MIYLDVFFLLLALIVFVWTISGIIALACGAPAVYADSRAIAEIFRLAKVKKNQVILDLGCGDARSLIIAAKNYGVQGIGLEVSPFAYLKAKLNVVFSGRSKNIKIYFGDVRKAKNEIKKAIKLVYGVSAERVAMTTIAKKTVTRRGITSVKQGGKKAVVHLKKGDKITFA